MPNEPVAGVEAALKWRRRLQEDAGASARLRRAGDAFAALTVPQTHELLRAVRVKGARREDDLDRRLIVLAVSLPRLKQEGGPSLAAVFGAGEERPRLSPARFGALVRAARRRDWEDFASALRRALAVIGDAPVDVAGFARDLIGFGDAVLRRWTYEYWGAQAPQTGDDAP